MVPQLTSLSLLFELQREKIRVLQLEPQLHVLAAERAHVVSLFPLHHLFDLIPARTRDLGVWQPGFRSQAYFEATGAPWLNRR